MARDNRDLNFERALAQNLRSAAAKPADPHDACADAELLAAYHERSLQPDQSASLKQHIATCPRCQQVLAHLAATDALPTDALPADTPEPEQATVLATPAVATKTPRAAILGPARPRWIAPWRWLAPAGAFAAALLVWIVTHEQKLPSVQVANNQERPASTPAQVPPPAPPHHADTFAPAAKPAQKIPSAGEKADAITPAFDSQKQRRQSGLRDKDSASAKKQTTPSDNAIAQDLFQHAQALDEPTLDGKLEARAEEANKNAAASAPPPPSPAPNKESAAGAPQELKRADAQPGAHPDSGVAGGAIAAQSLQQQQEMAGRSLYRSTTAQSATAIVLAKTKSLGLISASGGNIVWRVGPAGMIERSTDAGTTWTVQTSGVVNDLLTGSAPSGNVCWIAGRAGTILRTTDGGAHWQKVQPPVTGDFTLLFAVNAQQATVSAAQETYQTTDGGLTWKKLSPE